LLAFDQLACFETHSLTVGVKATQGGGLLRVALRSVDHGARPGGSRAQNLSTPRRRMALPAG
jgi:hypothetical protein